jgi:HPt (histidine-containing phosphotransfer) domain-containing protein
MDSPPLTPSGGGVPAGPTAGGEPARWVEPEVLAELEAELEGPELARKFARDYAALWDQRFSRLAAAVRAGDRPDALDAIISLRTASAMVGGVRLAMQARSLESAIRRDDFARGQDLLAGVAEHGASTIAELQAKYILKN